VTSEQQAVGSCQESLIGGQLSPTTNPTFRKSSLPARWLGSTSGGNVARLGKSRRTRWVRVRDAISRYIPREERGAPAPRSAAWSNRFPWSVVSGRWQLVTGNR